MFLPCNDNSILSPPVNPFNRVTSPSPASLHHGRGLLLKAATMKTPLKRFWSKVNKRGPIPKHMPHLGRCWEWERSLYITGYASFWNGSKQMRGHRWIYEHMFGEIPIGIFICHKCDNRKCVRPSHLFAGTRSDNMKDCYRKGRYPLEVMQKNCKAMREAGALQFGSKNPMAKLTEAQAMEALKCPRVRGASDEMAKRFGVARGVINKIRSGMAWRHLKIKGMKTTEDRMRNDGIILTPVLRYHIDKAKADSEKSGFERGLREAIEICRSRESESDFTIEATRCRQKIESLLDKPKDSK